MTPVSPTGGSDAVHPPASGPVSSRALPPAADAGGCGVLSEAEKRRRDIRVHWMTVDHGWPQDRADHWADTLVVRDREKDDRRMCVECVHVLSQWRCARKGPVLAQVLQRCHLFGWRVPG